METCKTFRYDQVMPINHIRKLHRYNVSIRMKDVWAIIYSTPTGPIEFAKILIYDYDLIHSFSYWCMYSTYLFIPFIHFSRLLIKYNFPSLLLKRKTIPSTRQSSSLAICYETTIDIHVNCYKDQIYKLEWVNF